MKKQRKHSMRKGANSRNSSDPVVVSSSKTIGSLHSVSSPLFVSLILVGAAIVLLPLL